MVAETHMLGRLIELGGFFFMWFERNKVEELWVSVVTNVFDGFAGILIVATGEGGGGGSENLMGF